MKKLASLLLALVMIMSCIPAMAEETTETTDQKIEVTLGDTGLNRTFAIYQIFTGELFQGKLSNVKWGKNGTGETGTLVDTDLQDEVAKLTNASNDQAKLEKILTLVNLSGEVFATIATGETKTVDAGYYLFKDTTTITEGHEASLYIVQVIEDVNITPKAGKVTSEKKVQDTNDSTGETSNWQDSADYDIGDDVPFQLKGTVTQEYDNYETYYFAFHDDLSDGLSFNNEVKVYVDGNEITEGFTVVTTDLDDDCDFEVVFNNLKTIAAVEAGSVITVEYTAKLTGENVKFGEEGNINTMYVEYSNNPNEEQDGEPDTGKTPDDTVIVFTYKGIVNKVNENKEALEGAGFTLYKWDAAKNDWVQIGEEITGVTTFTFNGLDEGKYKLVESTTPNGYNTVADIIFVIESTITDDNLTALEVKDEAGNELSNESDEASFSANYVPGEVETTVVNQSGATLPETGGMGTTILYVGGGILVLAAIVMLIVKRRAAAE